MFILIGNDEIGIVNKKWASNLSLRLPPGRIIALNGEPGIQAKILEPGPHFGYSSLQYTITKVPVITISQEEIGLVEAKDGYPLESAQNFAKVVDCNNFQDIKAFFDNGGQIGKQQAILNPGTYFINTEMFRCRKVPVIRIEAHQIGLVEAQDGSPLKPGKNFGRIVNCKYFQDAQAFFDNGGQVGKQIDFLPPGTYKINTDLFKIILVEQLSIGTEEIGLVEAQDGVSLKPGESFGKVVDCDDFQDGSEFIRKGGQKGKQRTILTEGIYQINTELFRIRKVPITYIFSEEIGLVETEDGQPLKQGENFAKKVDCNNFQDAQAFFDNGGQAGKQLATLRAGKYYINTDIFKIKKVSATTISSGEIGLVEAKYGKPLEQGKNFAKKVDCNDFQDAEAFFDNGGQAGKQIATLEPGIYYINPEIFTIRTVPIIRIPQGEIGLVIANEGVSQSDEQTLGRVVECNNFQDAEAFLKNGGQKGKQLAILSDGDYKINTDFFSVITTANANKYDENSNKLKIYKISSGKIGIVTTTVGKTLPKDEIAGPVIEGHDNYQNAQKFLDLGGYKGLQEEVIKEGNWKLNPWFVEVEQVPLTRIEQDEVGVVISFVGKKYDKNDDNQSTSLDENEYTYQLVPEGYQGVEKKPLMAGDYAINTRIKKVQLVPTTQIILNWSDEEKHPWNYDAKLKTLKLTSFDGREFKVQFTQMIRIAPENAPKMICQIGAQAAEVEETTMNDSSGKTIKKYPAIRNLVVRVLTRVVEGHFKQAATDKTAIEFQQAIVYSQNAAKDYIQNVLKENGVEGHGTYINAVDLPEDLDKRRQELEDLKQQQIKAKEESDTIKKQIDTAQERQKLVAEEQRVEHTKKLIDAQTNLEIEKATAEANWEREKTTAKIDKLHLDNYQKRLDIETSQQERISLIEINAFKDRIAVLSPELYVQIETQGKWAEAMAQMEINYPQIMMTGGGNSSSGDPTSNYFRLLQLDHLEAMRNRLTPGTPTASFPPSATKSFPPPNQETKSLKHSTEPHCPVVLLLDTSSSMSGEHINKLNDGITAFGEEFVNSNVSEIVDLAIVTCNSHRETFQGFDNMDNFAPITLKAEGETTIGKGIDLALNEIESYQHHCQSNNFQCRKPWLFLIIGSSPTDNWQSSAKRVREVVEANKLNFFLVGVKGVDMITLRQFAPPYIPPKMLDNFKFRELFEWLADYLKKVASSETGTKIKPLPTTEWEQVNDELE
ncbi:MAG: SPFH domain-containing protein [Crocosphaera sp.]|nr:SPFH domain-containing protein [Crocosphaera sp.]